MAVDLKHATEGAQVGGGADGLAVFCIDIGRERMTQPPPGPAVNRIAPQPSDPGPAAPGIEHWQGGIVDKQLRCRQGAVLSTRSQSGFSLQHLTGGELNAG